MKLGSWRRSNGLRESQLLVDLQQVLEIPFDLHASLPIPPHCKIARVEFMIHAFHARLRRDRRNCECSKPGISVTGVMPVTVTGAWIALSDKAGPDTFAAIDTITQPEPARPTIPPAFRGNGKGEVPWRGFRGEGVRGRAGGSSAGCGAAVPHVTGVINRQNRGMKVDGPGRNRTEGRE